MVCIYCSSSTQVTNSRLQKRANQVWRRRSCQTCGNTFTTHEKADLEAALAVRHQSGDIQPFSRDRLYISLYESCKHRAQPITDADGLTQTVLSLLRQDISNGSLTRDAIAQRALEVLQRFDSTASTMYAAYHPTKKRI
jgi:transcriptional repressor NrdR